MNRLLNACFDCDLPPRESHVLAVLCTFADSQGHNAYPRISLLAHKTGYKERHVQRLLRRLEEKRCIQSTPRRGQSTVYTITPEHGPQKPPYEFLKNSQSSNAIQSNPPSDPSPTPSIATPYECLNPIQTTNAINPRNANDCTVDPSISPPEGVSPRTPITNNIRCNLAITPDNAAKREPQHLDKPLRPPDENPARQPSQQTKGRSSPIRSYGPFFPDADDPAVRVG